MTARHPYDVIPKLGGAEQIVQDDPVIWNVGQTGLPFADDSIFDHLNSHRNYDATFEWMPIEEFMDAQYEIYAKFFPPRRSSNDAPFLKRKEYWAKTVTQSHVNKIIDLMKRGEIFDALVIELDKNGDLLDFQEGRHRSAALKQLGIKKLPVWIVKKRF